MFSNRNSLAFAGGVIGLAALGYFNWRLWQKDKVVLATAEAKTSLPPLESWEYLPRVSVLVAAWNEAISIERLIESFHRLRYPSKELVLCAGGQDGTYEKALCQAVPNVIVLKQMPGEGKQRSLRRCLQQSIGSVIFLTDADCQLDNASFEATLYPVACGNEQAASGFHRPYPDQIAKPFVMVQAASQFYSAMHSPEYSPGLTGANCAIERSLLERSGGLDTEAATGTDYVLAKMLTRASGSIRLIPQSRVATEYPETISAYLRQQRRWLRNVAFHGTRFEAANEVRSSLRTSIVGAGMLSLPFGAVVLGPGVFVLWLLLMFHAIFSRVRYLRFTSIALDLPLEIKHIAFQIPMLLLDFIAWSLTLLDYLSPQRRSRW